MFDDFIGNQKSEILKKILSLSAETFFLTEENLKKILKERSLPKEFIASFIESTQKTKKDFFDQVSKEFINKISKNFDINKLIKDIVLSHEIECQFKIQLHKKKGAKISKKIKNK